MGFDDKRVGAAEARLSELILEYNFLHSGVGQDGLILCPKIRDKAICSL